MPRTSRHCLAFSELTFPDARELSTAFYLGQGAPETPYTSYILPMTRNVPCIRYAVAATASSHLGNRLASGPLRTQSLQLRLEAIKTLKSQLTEVDPSALACMLLLAQLDVSPSIEDLRLNEINKK